MLARGRGGGVRVVVGGRATCAVGGGAGGRRRRSGSLPASPFTLMEHCCRPCPPASPLTLMEHCCSPSPNGCSNNFHKRVTPSPAPGNALTGAGCLPTVPHDFAGLGRDFARS
jgi:hypothetical protein